MKQLAPSLILILTSGCMRVTPPAPPVPRSAMPVAASFGKTWDAVIDVFAVKNIPIRTLERVSGLIAAEPSSVEGVELGRQHPWADCGVVAGFFGLGNKSPRQPNRAYYNVRVKGDSARSTLLVTIGWKHDPPGDASIEGGFLGQDRPVAHVSLPNGLER